MPSALRSALIPTLLSLAAGCAPSLLETEATDTPTPGATPVGDVVTLSHDGDLTLSRVDASANDRWIYLDLDAGAQVYPADPTTDGAWDLAFQRYVISLNGGVSGGADVAAAILPGADLTEVTQAPSEGYLTDAPDSDADENTEPDRALDGWYDYDPATHVLTPADLVYVVRSSDGAAFKLAFAGYYDDAGSSGFPSFWWAEIDAP